MSNIIQPSRRGFIAGLISFVAAPAVIRTIDLMPVKEPIITNIIPVTNGGTGYVEITEVMRRAFIPKLYAQIYAQHPIMGKFTGEVDDLSHDL